MTWLRTAAELTSTIIEDVAIGLAAVTAILLVDAVKSIMRLVPRTFGQGPRREDERL